jgi:hypothetical protein
MAGHVKALRHRVPAFELAARRQVHAETYGEDIGQKGWQGVRTLVGWLELTAT